MMKKLVVLILVFGLASIASAVPVMHLGTSTAPFPTDNTTITIAESGVIGYELYLWASSDIPWEEGVPETGVDIAQLALQLNDISKIDLQGHSITKFTAVSGNPMGTTVVAGRAYDGTDKIKGALLSVDGVGPFSMSMLFKLVLDVYPGGTATCLNLASPLETYIGNTVAGTKYRAFDSVSFVPEPATIALFGLGGLLLRRRK
jgi:hypothetical protein